MFRMFRGCVTAMTFLSLASAPLAAPKDEDFASQRSTVERQRTDLRGRIQTLQKELDGREVVRKEAADALKSSEVAISQTTRRLNDLNGTLKEARAELEALKKQIQQQQTLLAQRREELAKQLRSQYASGLSPWSALLSGDNPQDLSRHLAYLDYISQARAKVLAQIKLDVDRLGQLLARQDLRQKEVVALVEEATQQRDVLDAQKKERATVLARIEGQIQAQRTEALRLGQDEQRLGSLIDGLERQIKAAQQAEEARQAQEARRLQEVKKIELARQAQEAERQAQENTRRAEGLRAQEQAQIEAARLAAQSQERAQAARTAESAVSTEAGQGLKPGLRWPLRGRIMARFGTDRPEGGIWRGILIKAAEGASIQAVGGGTVVYANWLRGFGNLLILDHGEQYLSIYAYNQSLLKQVGDTVRTGEAVALAGSTGGQLDSALYFEIRHRGTAVDPLTFLSR